MSLDTRWVAPSTQHHPRLPRTSSTLRYDNVGRKRQSVWYDGMSTAMYYPQGTISDDGRTLTFTGIRPDPMSGTMKPYMHVLKIMGDDKHAFEMHEVGDGRMKKIATMMHTRTN